MPVEKIIKGSNPDEVRAAVAPPPKEAETSREAHAAAATTRRSGKVPYEVRVEMLGNEVTGGPFKRGDIVTRDMLRRHKPTPRGAEPTGELEPLSDEEWDRLIRLGALRQVNSAMAELDADPIQSAPPPGPDQSDR